MGLRSLNERLQDPECVAWFGNLFPRDTPRNMRFSINFFTSIGLGGLTDALRKHLAELPKILAARREEAAAAAAASETPFIHIILARHVTQKGLDMRVRFNSLTYSRVKRCRLKALDKSTS